VRRYRQRVTALAFLIGVIVLVIGLAVSIALHEIGHLVPAKLFGVRVGQYMVGMGPTVWSRKRGETEYGIKALPIGGYISMAGMYPPAADDANAPTQGRGSGRRRLFATMVQDARDANAETLIAGDDRVFYKLPVYKRIIVMLGGPFMNLVLAFVFISIALSVIGVQTATTTVASVSQCVIPASENRADCTSADPIAPAAAAGIQPGDELVSVDGTPVSTFEQAAAIIRDAAGRALPVVISRDGVEQTVSVTPRSSDRAVTDERGRQVVDAAGQPEYETVGFAGLSPQVSLEPQPIWAGPEATVQQIGAVMQIMTQLPVRVYDTAVDLFTGQERDPNGPLSVVGAGRLAGEVAAIDAPIAARAGSILGLLGSLNIALLVFNLIPLLPLDGGHVVVALWDGLKRRIASVRGRVAAPVDATKLVPATFVVVVLLVAMGGILIAADIFNPIQLL